MIDTCAAANRDTTGASSGASARRECRDMSKIRFRSHGSSP
jgi:hypothetical protein